MSDTQKQKYAVFGNALDGYGVEEVGGGILYDLIDSRNEAEIIETLLNRGEGPEWDMIADRVGSALTKAGGQ